MNRLIMISAALAALGLAACDRPAVVAVPGPTVAVPGPTVAVPVPVPGPAGPQGAPGSPGSEGAKGDPGKPGDSTTVIVTPPAPSK